MTVSVSAALALGFAAGSPLEAALIGTGAGAMGGLADGNGGRTNIDQSFVNLAPGIYNVDDFNFWGVNTNGTVQPFLSRQTVGAPNQQYTPIWTGSAGIPVAGVNTVTYPAGSQ